MLTKTVNNKTTNEAFWLLLTLTIWSIVLVFSLPSFPLIIDEVSYINQAYQILDYIESGFSLNSVNTHNITFIESPYPYGNALWLSIWLGF